jgi:bifunctional UDP-N-acetylglucosamine pyrophosphorylase/glucosamine-1-phosphate N-acetyltransferase
MKTNIKFDKTNNYQLSQNNLRNKAVKRGVNLLAPDTIFLSTDTYFGKNVTIEPYVVIGPKVKIGNNVVIKSFSYLEGAVIKNKVTVGPYARLRPGTILEENSKVGNFVEIKKSKVRKNSKVNHLSYIGDAEIGKNSNIGAGTITCNYDGIKKYRTKISNNVFVGSNTSLIAPIKIDKNAVIGAGSVITKNVKKNSLAITRALQEEILNYRRKKKK